MDNNKKYVKAMQAWGKEIALWQLANPDKDWLDELIKVKAEGLDDGGGSNPPPPPPPKPPGS